MFYSSKIVLQLQKESFSLQDTRLIKTLNAVFVARLVFPLLFSFCTSLSVTETNLAQALYFLHVKKLAFAAVAIILCRVNVTFTCRNILLQM
jgi:hypothetical protein